MPQFSSSWRQGQKNTPRGLSPGSSGSSDYAVIRPSMPTMGAGAPAGEGREPRSTQDPPPPPETPSTWSTKGLDGLGSQDLTNIIDLFEMMRNTGMSKHISLPQLVVCGDQSSGKSSVLQAIAQIPFPHSSKRCTRFATEVTIRRSPIDETTVSIRPYDFNSLSAAQKQKLQEFRGVLKSIGDLPSLIARVGEYMSFTSGSEFSKDVLQIEIAGPTRNPLILVDLPGLIRNGPDVGVVEDLVDRYMQNPRTTILVVISAASDPDVQGVLHRAKIADPQRRRTLGIITKPDKADRGLESEEDFIRLAQNEVLEFKTHLGWHVLMNGSSTDANTLADFDRRDAEERRFFRESPWAKLGQRNLGIAALKERLSNRLLQHFKDELKGVKGDFASAIRDCRRDLAGMGEPHLDIDSQRKYLDALGKEFHSLCLQGIWGSYRKADFFGTGCNSEYQGRYLRAVIQNYNDEFAETMWRYGHEREIAGYRLAPLRALSSEDAPSRFSLRQQTPTEYSREEAINSWVKPVSRSTRGPEIGDGRNPIAVKMLFCEQSQRWRDLALQQLNDCSDACRNFLALVLNEIAPESVRNALDGYIDMKMSEKRAAAEEELNKILKDCRDRLPITVSYQFFEDINNSRRERAIRSSGDLARDVSPSLESLGYFPERTETSPEYQRCEASLDEMLAYYETARRRFVDDVVVQVIERRLVGELENVFWSSGGMSDGEVNSITEEPLENQNKRAQLGDELKNLLEGEAMCGKYSQW